MNDPAPAPAPGDNRRLSIRLLAHQAMRTIGALCEMHDYDAIELLVFTAVWTSNTEHLQGQTERYAELYDIPPDSQRRPVGEAELLRLVPLPPDILTRYLEAMIASGRVERVGAGFVVPSAVFTDPAMLSSLNEIYTRATGLIAALQAGAGKPAKVVSQT